MNLEKNWPEIQQVFESAFKSSFHFSVATVDSQGFPHVTPIGSLILRDDMTGYYFEQLPMRLPDNLNRCRHVAVMALNSDSVYWADALAKGKFETYPGVRLMGTVGDRRKATTAEIDAWHQKVAPAKGMRGYDILWKNMKMVRDISFTAFRPVECRQMTADL